MQEVPFAHMPGDVQDTIRERLTGGPLVGDHPAKASYMLDTDKFLIVAFDGTNGQVFRVTKDGGRIVKTEEQEITGEQFNDIFGEPLNLDNYTDYLTTWYTANKNQLIER